MALLNMQFLQNIVFYIKKENPQKKSRFCQIQSSLFYINVKMLGTGEQHAVACV